MPTEHELMRHALPPGDGLNLLWERAQAGDTTAHAAHTAILPILTRVATHRCALDDMHRLTTENERLSRALVRLLDRVEHLEIMVEELSRDRGDSVPDRRAA